MTDFWKPYDIHIFFYHFKFYTKDYTLPINGFLIISIGKGMIMAESSMTYDDEIELIELLKVFWKWRVIICNGYSQYLLRVLRERVQA